MAPALIGGTVGLVLAPRGRLSRVLRFTFADGRIAIAEAISDPARLDALDIAALDTLGEAERQVTCASRAWSWKPCLRC